ncbi:MAG: hypothetical protein AABN33_02925 [Acidobacteriota bacterium]
MYKTAIIALVLLAIVSCGGTAPPPTRSAAQPFSIISEQADPAASSLMLLITVSGPATQPSVKSIAESVITSRRGEYRHIIVKSYAEGMTASDTPFAVSRLEDGTVTHRFSSLAETQKIQTH